MFLKRKISIMATMALLSASLLAGCSSTDDGGGEVTGHDVLANQSAREAIGRIINKQEMTDVLLNNGSTPIDRLTPSGLAKDNGKDYYELTEGMGYSYDEELAQEAWAKAKEEVGFETIEIEMLTTDTDLAKKMGEFIQGEVSALEGLTLKLTNLPFEQKLERETNADFEMAFSGWGADYPDPLTFLKTMETDAQFAKQTGYSSEEVDTLIKEAKKLPKTEAYAKYAEAEKLILEDGYLMPIYQAGKSYVQKEGFTGLIENAYGAEFTYKFADIDNADKVLNLREAADIPTLDVSKATDTVSFGVMNNTMEGLTRVDQEGKVIPGIAETWEPSEDGLTWTFKLRENATWSNGDPVTAKDFEYSWGRTLDPATASEYGYIMDDIESFKAVDDHTFEVKLNRPVSYFAEMMSFQVFFPQNQAFVEECGDKYGTGAEYQVYNGPFTLTSWKMEDAWTMEKNDSYWDASTVKLETINTKVVKDQGAVVNLYKDGHIDRVGLTAEYVVEYKDSPEFHTKGDAVTWFLQINAGQGSTEEAAE